MSARWVLVAGIGAALAALAWFGLSSDPEGGAPVRSDPERASPAPAPDGEPSAARAEGELSVAKGERIAIPASALSTGEPVAVTLLLPELPGDPTELPVRLLSGDGRQLETKGRIGADRRGARVEIDPSFLSPGRYLVEIKTTEKTHLPLRRYVLEVGEGS